MATRTIVTSQPDVECEVCERRLLRGEQPDVFLAAGRRRIVCELCAPRAAHEGWMRETDSQSLSLPPMRPRRGRSLFERLRQVTKPAAETRDVDAPARQESEPYDLFDRVADSPRASTPVPARPTRSNEPRPVETEPSLMDGAAVDAAGAAEARVGAVPQDAVVHVETDSGRDEAGVRESPSAYVEQAIAVFNASEFPRRVAGVTRSLGAASVNVRSAEHLSSVVSIVVAWELCWYRYQVDLSEPVVEAQVIAQGTELAELAREDRLANAAAEESGMLVFVGV